MGFLKKKGGDDVDDANRSALFSRKAKASPANSANPYAAPPANDPYAQQPPPYSGGNDSFRQEKSPAVTGPGQRFGGGYSSQGGSFGGRGGAGYGADRFGGAGLPSAPNRRPGGYGGALFASMLP